MWFFKTISKFSVHTKHQSNLIISSKMATSPKKLKLAQPKSIGTHNGCFHCDEVLACYMLLKLYPNTPIIRTRDPTKLSSCSIVVDVGSVYDAEKGRFDHHQKSFDSTMKSLTGSKRWNTKLSSAGLVYHHFGREVISLLVGGGKAIGTEDEDVEEVWDRVYEALIHSVDGIDNGVPVAEGSLNYLIRTDLSSRVAGLNPPWNHPQCDDEVFVRGRFEEAMAMVGKEFEDKVEFFWKSWLPAKQCVKEAYERRYEVDSSGEVMVFEGASCPWKEHLLSIEDPAVPSVKYVLYAEQSSAASSAWRIQCVPVDAHSFVSRRALPEEWRGLRGEELSKKVGLERCVFVHINGFTGGHQSREGALAMARKALRASEGTV